jgi:hypothetical protein
MKTPMIRVPAAGRLAAAPAAAAQILDDAREADILGDIPCLSDPRTSPGPLPVAQGP